MYLFMALCMPMTMGMIPWVAPSLHNCGDTLHEPDNILFVHRNLKANLRDIINKA
jgi:hypothetical protein